MKQLTGLDAAFLYMETGTSFGHVNSLSIYSRPDDPEFDPYESFKRQIAARLGQLEPFRRRLVNVPLELDHPYWINDPDFDLDFHVRHIAVPPPGGDQELAELVGRLIGRPMDRSRPLWEVYVVEGLASGDFAVVFKIHHATIDGAAGAELSSMMLDHEPGEPPPEHGDEWTADRVPTQAELLVRTASEFARRPGRLVRLQSELVREAATITRSEGLHAIATTMRRGLPGPLGSAVRRALGGDRPDTERDEAPTVPRIIAPPTPFNRAITPHRRFAFRAVPLDDIKTLKSMLGATVNDVVMAACTGALRRYLLDHDALPDRPLMSMVPVSIRTGEEEDRWTNRVSAIFVSIPTDVEAPLDRIAAVHQSMVDAKGRHDLLPADLIIDAAQFAPPALAARAARVAARLKIADRLNPPINLVISNVPGPREPLYLGQAQLKHYYPVSTIVDGQGLNITVQSYLDTMDFGLVACRELLPDLDILADYCVDEIDRMYEAIGEQRPSVANAPKPEKPAKTKSKAKSGAATKAPKKKASPVDG